MIKFIVEKDQKKLIGFGLTKGNLELLMKGKPIWIALEQLGVPGGYEIVIYYGRTEQKLMDDLKEMIGDDTIIYHGQGELH